MNFRILLSFLTGGAAGAAAMYFYGARREAPADGAVPAGAAVPQQAVVASIPGRAAGAGPVVHQQQEGKKAEEPAQADQAAARALVQSLDLSAIMAGQHAREVTREADRLALRLKLSPDQKAKLTAFLEEQKRGERAQIDAVMQAVKKGEKPPTQDPATLTGKGKTEALDAFLASTLTPEQNTEYAKAREEARVSKAEDAAHARLRRLERMVDLTPAQKDSLFQGLAQQRLQAAPEEASASVALGTAAIEGISPSADVSVITAGPADVPDAVEMIDLAGGFGAPQSAEEKALLQSVLTPEQMKIVEQREQEQKASGFSIQIGQ